MTSGNMARGNEAPNVQTGVGQRIGEVVLRYGMIGAIVLLIAYFGVVNDNFLSVGNFLDILRAVSILAIVAIGVTLSVIVGGLDASIGAVTGLSVILAPALMVIWGVPWYAAVPLTYGAGLLVGLLNGFLIVKLRIPDLLATLGMLYLVSGLQLGLTKGDAVYRGMTNPWSADRTLTTGEIAPVFLHIGQGYVLSTATFSGIPLPVVIMVVVVLGFHLFLNYTRYGRVFYAVGGNSEAARLAGVDVNRYRALAYVISALLATTGGLVLAARIGSGAIRAGDPYLLDSVSATYFGFAVLIARRPNVLGTALGALFVGVMLNGLTMMNMPWYSQDVVKGVVLIISLGLSFYLSRRT